LKLDYPRESIEKKNSNMNFKLKIPLFDQHLYQLRPLS